MGEQRRWTIYLTKGVFTWAEGSSSAPCGLGSIEERVEVMPVSEHKDARKALSEMQARWSGMVEQSKQHVERARTAQRQAEAKLARLRAIEQAARPFVVHADLVDSLRHPDDSTDLHRIRAGDLRALRAALAAQDETGGEPIASD